MGGGVRPPRVTEERKPAVWRESVRARSMLVEGMEVRPRRALEAFWRCEQTFARCTRDMVAVDGWVAKRVWVVGWGARVGATGGGGPLDG